MLDRTASPASKAFNKSRPRRLMSLALAFIMTIFSSFRQTGHFWLSFGIDICCMLNDLGQKLLCILVARSYSVDGYIIVETL